MSQVSYRIAFAFASHRAVFTVSYHSSWAHPGHPGHMLGHPGPPWAHPGGTLGHPGRILGVPWAHAGRTLGAPWDTLGAPWAHPGHMPDRSCKKRTTQHNELTFRMPRCAAQGPQLDLKCKMRFRVDETAIRRPSAGACQQGAYPPLGPAEGTNTTGTLRRASGT